MSYRIILFCLVLQGVSSFAQTQENKKPLIIAHRGASGLAPENTIASIDKALEIGADVIEIDVHQTKDSVIILMHDVKLDRTTNKEGFIKDYNWAEISDADAGGWFSPQFAGEHIPTLEEVIRHINGKANLLIEIKKDGNYYPAIERRVLAIIRANKAESWCMVQAFSKSAVNTFLDLDSDVPVYKLVLRGASLRLYDGVNPHHGFTGKRIVRKLHERGQQIFVWTVNEEKKMKKLVGLGVDGIITNYPDRLKALLED